MLSWLGLAIVSVATVSSFTVHQHSDNRECINLQCPEAAFDYGVKNLVNDETMRSDSCTSCEQCTENGYSLCMRQKDSRAHRTATESTGFCSCAHSVPANCHNQLHVATHPANITMKLYNLCYLSAIQAPPKPLSVNEKDFVIVTIEPFWHEPYWRDMELNNLTLHYEFVVKTPESCEGEVITLESDHLEHLCKNSLNINMTSQLDGPPKDDDYEHSENYDQYDDDLPPEVQFDRDVFSGAKLLKAYYTVDVRRPRQLDAKNSDPFRDLTTSLESEHLKFDLKPELYGDGTPKLPKVADGKPAGSIEAEEDDEDVSSEHPSVGTDFFDDGKKKEEDTKSEEALEKEEEDLEKKIAEEEKEEEEEATTTVAAADDTTEAEEEKTEESEKADDEKKEEESETKEEDDKKEETDEDKEEVKEEEEAEAEEEEAKAETEEESKDEEDETTVDEEKDKEDDKEEDKEDDKEDAEADAEEKAVDDEQNDETDKEKEETDNAEKDADDEEGQDDEEDDESDNTEGQKSFIGTLLRDQYHLARWVFGITIASCLLLILCTCCYRRGFCCCKPSETKTTSNGCRYTNANRPELVSQVPEKERLRQ